jgi:hypothetical protein
MVEGISSLEDYTIWLLETVPSTILSLFERCKDDRRLV